MGTTIANTFYSHVDTISVNLGEAARAAGWDGSSTLDMFFSVLTTPVRGMGAIAPLTVPVFPPGSNIYLITRVPVVGGNSIVSGDGGYGGDSGHGSFGIGSNGGDGADGGPGGPALLVLGGRLILDEKSPLLGGRAGNGGGGGGGGWGRSGDGGNGGNGGGDGGGDGGAGARSSSNPGRAGDSGLTAKTSSSNGRQYGKVSRLKGSGRYPGGSGGRGGRGGFRAPKTIGQQYITERRLS